MLKREKFSNEIITLLAMLSGTLGVGSIVKFPTTVAENGGAIFILFYFVGLFLIAIPAFFSEILIGKKGHSNALDSYVYSGNNKKWSINGVLSIISSILALTYYSLLAGWIFRYFYLSLFGFLDNISSTEAVSIFYNFVSNLYEPYLWFVLFLVTIGIMSSFGIKNGLEKAIKILVPIFLVIFIILIIKSCFSSGSLDAIKFLLLPDFSKLNVSVIINAIGLSFLKLTLGSGVMITYGSYSGLKFNILKNCSRVAFIDLFISLLMGFIIFSNYFSSNLTNLNKSIGLSLLFETIPLAFNNTLMDKIFLKMFFGIIFFIVLMGGLALIEVTVSTLSEKKKINRKLSGFLIVIIVLVLGIVPSLSESVLQFFSEKNLQLFIGNNQVNGIINIIDKIICNFMLPLSSLGAIILVGYKIKKERVKKELKKFSKNSKIISVCYIILKISPFLLFFIILLSNFL